MSMLQIYWVLLKVNAIALKLRVKKSQCVDKHGNVKHI